MMHTWFECKIRYEKVNGKRHEQESNGTLFG